VTRALGLRRKIDQKTKNRKTSERCPRRRFVSKEQRSGRFGTGKCARRRRNGSDTRGLGFVLWLVDVSNTLRQKSIGRQKRVSRENIPTENTNSGKTNRFVLLPAERFRVSNAINKHIFLLLSSSIHRRSRANKWKSRTPPHAVLHTRAYVCYDGEINFRIFGADATRDRRRDVMLFVCACSSVVRVPRDSTIKFMSLYKRV